MKASHRGRDSGHLSRIGFISREIATSLRLSREDVDEIHYAALLYESSKGNPYSDTSTAFTFDKKRKGQGVETARLSKAQDYVYYHQEHWDGSGHPEGLQKKEIPLGARIIRMAIEYIRIMQEDTIVDKIEKFQEACSTVIDPDLAEHFLRTFDFETMNEQRGYGKVKANAFERSAENELQTRMEDSELLRNFRMYQSVIYKNGKFLDEREQETVVPIEECLKSILEGYRFSVDNNHVLLEDQYSGAVYDVHFFKMKDLIHVLIYDVTHLLTYEKQQEDKIRAMYRDVIFAVTQGKLLLQERHELEYGQGEELFDLPIQENEDISKAREVFAETIVPLFTKKEVYFLKLCLSEGATNVLKHADNGRARAYKENSMIRIVVSDNGNGIPLENLPKSALYAGYSSSNSLGQGYHLLLTFADRVLLSTDSEGTVVIIEKKLNQLSEDELVDSGK